LISDGGRWGIIGAATIEARTAVTELMTAAEVEEVGRDLVHLGFRVVTGSGGSWAAADFWLDPVASRYVALTPEASMLMHTIGLIQDWPERDQEAAWWWAMDKARKIVCAEVPSAACH
jgi:hypothetical protein